MKRKPKISDIVILKYRRGVPYFREFIIEVTNVGGLNNSYHNNYFINGVVLHDSDNLCEVGKITGPFSEYSSCEIIPEGKVEDELMVRRI